MTVLNARVPGVAGYYSSSDEYGPDVYAYTNQRRMVYMNVDVIQPGSSNYNGVLAHEFQHALHWNAAREEESWVNEGLSELGSHLGGYRVTSVGGFGNNPDTQLNAWPKAASLDNHYGASFLFMLYLNDHYRAPDGFQRLLSEPREGIRGVSAYLEGSGFPQRFEDVFQAWIVANYLQRSGTPQGYASLTFPLTTGRPVVSGQTTGQVGQYAADYLPLNYSGAGARLRFQGPPSVRVVPLDPSSGRRLWWSNTGDGRDSRMTRAFDLSGLARATLQFNAWWNIEEDWDFAYLVVSTDDGMTWTPVAASGTTDVDKVGQSYGHGFTGRSGGAAEWRPQTADLTPFVGRRVLVRFEYITDDAVNLAGFAIDDIRLPELSFADDAEQERGWALEGFARIDNVLPQRYYVGVAYGDGQVDWLDVGADGGGEISLRAPATGGRPPVLIIAGATPYTYEPARYEVILIP
jgi:hypothetical protein